MVTLEEGIVRLSELENLDAYRCRIEVLREAMLWLEQCHDGRVFYCTSYHYQAESRLDELFSILQTRETQLWRDFHSGLI